MVSLHSLSWLILTVGNRFEPPDIPRDWQPSPKRVFDLANKPTAENGAVPVTQGPSGRPPPPTDARGRPVLSADDVCLPYHRSNSVLMSV